MTSTFEDLNEALACTELVNWKVAELLEIIDCCNKTLVEKVGKEVDEPVSGDDTDINGT